MAKYLLEAPDDLMDLWKAEAVRAGESFAAWLRAAASARAGGVGDPAETGSAHLPSEGDGVRTPSPDPVPVRPPPFSTKKTFAPDPKG